jgi:hypothetical protein
MQLSRRGQAQFSAFVRQNGCPAGSSSSWRDVTVAAPTAFPVDTVQALAKLGPTLSPDECRAMADVALHNCGRSPERDYVTVLDVISVMLHDRSLVRLGEVEERCGIGARTLQRLFERVGTR